MASVDHYRGWVITPIFMGPGADYQALHDSFCGEPDLCMYADSVEELCEEIDDREDEHLEHVLEAELASELECFRVEGGL